MVFDLVVVFMLFILVLVVDVRGCILSPPRIFQLVIFRHTVEKMLVCLGGYEASDFVLLLHLDSTV